MMRRTILVVFAWLLCAVWLVTIFYIPGMDAGMEGLFAHIGAGFLITLYGAVLSILAATTGAVSLAFGLIVLFSYIIHAVGAAVEAPGCYYFFVGPSVVIFLAGLLELGLRRKKQSS